MWNPDFVWRCSILFLEGKGGLVRLCLVGISSTEVIIECPDVVHVQSVQKLQLLAGHDISVNLDLLQQRLAVVHGHGTGCGGLAPRFDTV